VAPGAVSAKPKITGLELQQIQSRDFEAPKTVTFSAVMSVLQDEGYRINAADKDTGLITAIASTKAKMTWAPFVGFGRKKKTPIVSAYIEERGAGASRLRLNFVMGRYKGSQYGSVADEKPITETPVYQDAFEKIQKAIFVRQAMDAPGMTPVGASVPASQPNQ
jgi:hypothetical protein